MMTMMADASSTVPLVGPSDDFHSPSRGTYRTAYGTMLSRLWDNKPHTVPLVGLMLTNAGSSQSHHWATYNLPVGGGRSGVCQTRPNDPDARSRGDTRRGTT